jgi:hypothetical protein
MARGHFSTSLYTALSRAQIEFGGPSTFGLEISRADNLYDPNGDEKGLSGSSFKLGDMISRGCYNYRWPVNEYHLDEYLADKTVEKHVGTCQMFSCAKDSIFYQALRIEENVSFDPKDPEGKPRPQFPVDSQVVLTMGGPVWFQSFNDRLGDHSVADNVLKPTDRVIDINKRPYIGDDDYRCQTDEIAYWNSEKQIGLRAKVYRLLSNGKYEQLPMIESASISDNGTTQDEFKTKAYNLSVKFPQLEDRSKSRSVTFVVAIHLFETESWDNAGYSDPPPSSQEIYHYVGVNPSNLKATGVMWETLFIERQNKSDSVLDIAEVGLIGRSVEKILQVDIVPAGFKLDADVLQSQVAIQENWDAFPSMPETVLMSNLFVRQNVDLKSLL